MRSITKEYNKVVKYKQKQFVENMFLELDSMQHDNPRGYMQLINSMREGNFDRTTPDDTSGVSPSAWYMHFSDLLAKKLTSQKTEQIIEYIEQNIELFKTKLDDQFSIEEFETALKSLKNSKFICANRIKTNQPHYQHL